MSDADAMDELRENQRKIDQALASLLAVKAPVASASQPEPEGSAFFWSDSPVADVGRFRPLSADVLTILFFGLTQSDQLLMTLTCRDMRNLHAHLVSSIAIPFTRRLKLPESCRVRDFQRWLSRFKLVDLNLGAAEPSTSATPAWQTTARWTVCLTAKMFSGTLLCCGSSVSDSEGMLRVVARAPVDLALSANGIGNAGAMTVVDAMKHTPQLVLLNLSRNHISRTDAYRVSDALMLCPRIHHLILSRNAILDEGAFAVAVAMKNMPLLNILNLTRNGISDSLQRRIDVALATRNLDIFWKEKNLKDELRRIR